MNMPMPNLIRLSATLGCVILLAACGDDVAAPGGSSPTSSNAEPQPSTDASASEAGRLRFENVTATSGIDMIMKSGGTPTREILEVNGGGLALIDYDNDGDDDLFVANGATMDAPEDGPGCRLYANVSDQHDGIHFEDVTESSGINITRWAMGAAVGDYDGNGYDDLYITCYGPNILLRNNGDGTFSDVTTEAGVGDERWGTSACFGDIDRDHDLDLYVVNYLVFDIDNPPRRAEHKDVTVMGGPHGTVPQADVLYRNNGDGTFTDITEPSGCAAVPPSYGLNLAILDFTNDGWQDIFVGNDSMENFLFRNDTAESSADTPRFTNIGRKSGIGSNRDGSNQATMGIGIADLDGNGLPDVFTTNFSSDTNTLHMNADGRFFDDRTLQYGLGMISRPYLGWTAAFYDFDHDGDEDLLFVNGHVYPEATPETMDSSYAQQSLLFERLDDRFEMVQPETAGAWLAEAHVDRPAVFGDLDHDGDVDFIIGELNGPIRVIENNGADDTDNWLVIELRDNRPDVDNHRGIGAKIQLTVQSEQPVTMTRWIHSGGSFQSSSAMQAHFAVPPQPAQQNTPLRLTITWPDGFEEVIDNPALGEHHVVERQPATIE